MGPRRPVPVLALVAALGLLGVTATAGGVEMALFPHGNAYLPAERLERIPLVDTYLVPGLVLGLGFGVGGLVTAAGMATRAETAWLSRTGRRARRHWSWALACGIGPAFAVWLAVEVILLLLLAPGGPALGTTTDTITELVFVGLAVVLILLPRLTSVRDDLTVTATGRGTPTGPSRA